MSHDDGRYEFTLLPPGEDYVIEINVPGFTPIRETGIKVRLGQTTISDVHLSVLTETQAAATYEIIEKVNPVLNPDSAQNVAVITAEKAAMTPSFHQVEGMAQQVAGVGPGNRPSTRDGLARLGLQQWAIFLHFASGQNLGQLAAPRLLVKRLIL